MVDDALLMSVGPAARLRPLSVLARGGMADVILADQTSLARPVAVKVAAGHRSAATQEGFLAETLVTAGLEHPGIVPVHDAGDDFMVMRCVHGRTLGELIEADGIGPEAVERHARLLLRVCDTVRFAHSRGIIHRDLKPANIMVGDFGEVVVLDWGLAVQVLPPADGRRRAPTPDRVESCAGTPAYMPPEIADADGARLSQATDTFLLGATLWHILTGRPPYRAESARRSVQAAWRMARPAITALNASAPPALIAVVERAMSRSPAERGDVAALAAGIEAWLTRAGGVRTADEARRTAETLLAGTPDWAALDAAVAACDRCLGVMPEDGRAAALRAQAQAARARLALAAGDLLSAEAAAAEAGSDRLLDEVAAERGRRQARDGRQRRLRSAGLVAAVMAAAVLVAAIIHLVQESTQTAAGRAQAALGLAAASELALADGTLAGCERAIALAERACAADPSVGQPALRQALAGGMRRGAAHGDGDYVRALEARLRAVPGSAALVTACAPLVVEADTCAARRAAAADRRHAADAERLARRAGVLAADPATADAASTLLAGWTRVEDVDRQVGDRRLVEGLLRSPSAPVRRIVITGLAGRPDLLPAERLAALAEDADPAVAAAARAAQAGR
jgi:hypothetical protein